MLELYQRNRSVVKLGLRAAIFTLLALAASAAPALAQTTCNTRGLSREGDSEHRLAIKTAKGWTRFHPNRTGPAHPLEIGDSQSELCMAWEAPPALGRQVVYVSTRFTEQQRLSLFRRGFVLGRTDDTVGDLDEFADDFRAYHGRPRRPSKLEDYLDSWHERLTSYDLVTDAVSTPRINLPYGSERLLTLLPLRPWKSWVRILGEVLEGRTLRVAVAYSGTGTRTYEYTFELR